MYDFLQKLKKLVRIVLYGPAISQSDCRKAGRISCHLIIVNIIHKVNAQRTIVKRCLNDISVETGTMNFVENPGAHFTLKISANNSPQHFS